MSPDIPLKIVEWFFQFGLVGFLIGIMALYAIFRGWLYYAMLGKGSERDNVVLDKAKELIRSEYWGTRYRVFLGKVLSRVTGIVGDHYRFPDEKPRFREGAPELEKLRNPSPIVRVFGVNPFTIESYHFCLLIAFLYPIISFTFGWALGGSGSIGGLDPMPQNVTNIDRWMVFITLFLLILLLNIPRNLFKKQAIVVIPAFLCLFAVGNDYTSFVVSAVLFFLVMTILTPISLPVIFFLPAVVGISLTELSTIQEQILLSTLVFLIFFFGGIYKKSIASGKLSSFYFLWVAILFVWSLAALKWIDQKNTVLAVLFFVLLPLANTILDWISLAVTRGLLQSIRFNHHRMRKSLIWGGFDLILAILALLLMSGLTVSIVSFVNLIAVRPVIDLEALFTSLSSLENWRDNLWIYFMLLSTLVPTAVHFALVGGALTLAVSKKQRRKILKDIEINSVSAKWAWIYISVMPAFGFVLAPTLLLFSLYWILHAHGAFLGNSLLAWAELLATWIDPTLGQLPKLIGA